MNKSLFIETIQVLQKQYEKDEGKAKLLAQVFPDAFDANLMYDNHLITNQIVKILQEQMNDVGPDSWIEYFLWELDFGRKYKPGCVIQQDGTHIDLSDAGSLWEFLNQQNVNCKKEK